MPDVYRKAMVDVLQPIPCHGTDRDKIKVVPLLAPTTATSVPTASQLVADANPAEPLDGAQAASQTSADGAFVPPSVQPATETPGK